MITLSTHVLDISTGLPAVGLAIRLQHYESSILQVLATGFTDSQGRIAKLGEAFLSVGHYQLVAETGQWFKQRDIDSLFLRAQLDIYLSADTSHYHLPFLIAPGGWSTYRGT